MTECNMHIKSQISISSLVNIIFIFLRIFAFVMNACCSCNALAIWSIRNVDSTKRFRALILRLLEAELGDCFQVLAP